MLDFSNTTIRADRSIFSYSKVQQFVSECIRNRRLFMRHPQDGEYLDVGCGPNLRSDFCDLDYSWRPGLDICWDITRGIPIRDQWIGGIFTEHCLEHIRLDDFWRVARDFFRILKNGAYIRIVVPDGEMYLRKYNECLAGRDSALPYAYEDVLHGHYTPIMSVNRIFREHGHLFIYDFETMKLVLESAGFSDVKRQQFGVGSDSRLLIDSADRKIESLYVEAKKII